MKRGGDINERTQAKLRSGIRAAEIINKLHAHILDGAKMTNTAVRASEILLRKVSPDMVATALSVQDSAKLPLLTIIRRDQPPKLVSGAVMDDKQATPGIDTPNDNGSVMADIPVTQREAVPSSSVKPAA